MKYYNWAVAFVKEALAKISAHDDPKALVDEKTYKSILRMKREFTLQHNKILTQKKDDLGIEHQVFPYLLDEKTLKRKSKQPKFATKVTMFI